MTYLLYALAAVVLVARAQIVDPDLGTLSPQELLLDPQRLEAGEGGILERWADITQFVERRLQQPQRGIAAAALTRALLQDLGWQKANDYAESISNSIWRARALLSIAADQFSSHNGRRFALQTLDRALGTLQALPERALGEEGEEAYRAAGAMLVQNGFYDLLERYARAESRTSARTALLQGALPYLSARGAREDARDWTRRIRSFSTLEGSALPLETLLMLSDVERQSGDTEASNRLLFEAYRRLATLPNGKARDRGLQRVVRYMLANRSFSDALRALRRISSPFPQSTLLAEAGRAMVQADKRAAGRTLLALAHDIARDLEGAERREALLHLTIERALAGDLAQAWESAQGLHDSFDKARGGLAIALVLNENGETERALDLLEHIPYANLRARLITHLAEPIVERLSAEQLSNMLITLVDSQDFSLLHPTWTPANLERILATQLRYGKSRKNKELFSRVTTIIDSAAQSNFARLQAQLVLLRYQARRSARHAERATRAVESILHQLWSYRNARGYGQALASATRFFLEREDTARALTLAVSLPREQPDLLALRDRLLSDIARFSAHRANERLALRAVNEISVERDKSYALAAVIDIAAGLKKYSLPLNSSATKSSSSQSSLR